MGLLAGIPLVLGLMVMVMEEEGIRLHRGRMIRAIRRLRDIRGILDILDKEEMERGVLVVEEERGGGFRDM